jgi:hypothetical protein
MRKIGMEDISRANIKGKLVISPLPAAQRLLALTSQYPLFINPPPELEF